ncbi:MAG: hypothetical protein JSS10_07735 [Verrucomicrobia bacterium]|nr:hypothetical protein [Verrucomicrobiota bacterium]
MAIEATSSSSASSVKFPTGTILGNLAEEMDKTRKSLERHKQITVLRPLKENGALLDQYSQAELAALAEVAQARDNQNRWAYAHLFHSILYAISSISYGAYLIADGKKEGWNLVKAGVFLFGNTAMEFTGGWRLASRLLSFGNEMGEEVLSKLLPILTTFGISIYTSQSFTKLSEENRQFMENLNWLMSWINMIIQATQLYTSWVKGQAERRLISIESKITAVRMGIDPLTQLNESQTAISKSINDRIKNGIKRIFNGTSALAQGA